MILVSSYDPMPKCLCGGWECPVFAHSSAPCECCYKLLPNLTTLLLLQLLGKSSATLLSQHTNQNCVKHCKVWWSEPTPHQNVLRKRCVVCNNNNNHNAYAIPVHACLLHSCMYANIAINSYTEHNLYTGILL